MSRILLVDATNNFLRNYAVVPTLNLDGERNGGVYGTLTTLAHFCKVCSPDKIVICWDGAGGSQKRRKILKDYKDGRKSVRPVRLNKNFEFEEEDIDANRRYQRHRLAQYLDDLPVTQIILDNIEADDVIAYLTHYYNNQGDQVVIASDDKDFFQLLSKNTVVYRCTKKEWYTNRELVEEHNIYPHNFALARSIAGDASDNVKGVDRVGLKNLLKYFPFMSDQDEVTLSDLMSFSQEQLKDKKKGSKYQKFIDAEDRLDKNFQVVQLYDPIISYSSVDLIIREVEKKPKFNATSFRSKLLVDGINTMGSSFFRYFKKLTF